VVESFGLERMSGRPKEQELDREELLQAAASTTSQETSPTRSRGTNVITAEAFPRTETTGISMEQALVARTLDQSRIVSDLAAAVSLRETTFSNPFDVKNLLIHQNVTEASVLQELLARQNPLHDQTRLFRPYDPVSFLDSTSKSLALQQLVDSASTRSLLGHQDTNFPSSSEDMYSLSLLHRAQGKETRHIASVNRELQLPVDHTWELAAQAAINSSGRVNPDMKLDFNRSQTWNFNRPEQRYRSSSLSPSHDLNLLKLQPVQSRIVDKLALPGRQGIQVRPSAALANVDNPSVFDLADSTKPNFEQKKPAIQCSQEKSPNDGLARFQTTKSLEAEDHESSFRYLDEARETTTIQKPIFSHERKFRRIQSNESRSNPLDSKMDVETTPVRFFNDGAEVPASFLGNSPASIEKNDLRDVSENLWTPPMEEDSISKRGRFSHEEISRDCRDIGKPSATAKLKKRRSGDLLQDGASKQQKYKKGKTEQDRLDGDASSQAIEQQKLEDLQSWQKSVWDEFDPSLSQPLQAQGKILNLKDDASGPHAGLLEDIFGTDPNRTVHIDPTPSEFSADPKKLSEAGVDELVRDSIKERMKTLSAAGVLCNLFRNTSTLSEDLGLGEKKEGVTATSLRPTTEQSGGEGSTEAIQFASNDSRLSTGQPRFFNDGKEVGEDGSSLGADDLLTE